MAQPPGSDQSYWSLARINTAAGQWSDPTLAPGDDRQCDTAGPTSPAPPCQGEVVTSVRLITVSGGLSTAEDRERESSEEASPAPEGETTAKRWMILVNTTAENEGHGWLYSVNESSPSSGHFHRVSEPLLQPIEDIVCSIISLRPGRTTMLTAQHLHQLLDEVQLPDVVLGETAQDWCLDVIFKLESEGVLEEGQALRLQELKD